jgi:hypothetical protein
MQPLEVVNGLRVFMDRPLLNPARWNSEVKEVRDENLRQMGSIYANAAFTIIAAAGTNPKYGLPDMSQDCIRDRQLFILVDDCMLVGMTPPRLGICRSMWNKGAGDSKRLCSPEGGSSSRKVKCVFSANRCSVSKDFLFQSLSTIISSIRRYFR